MPTTGQLIMANTITGTTITMPMTLITAIIATVTITGLIPCQAPAAHTMAAVTIITAIYTYIMHLITCITASPGY